MDTKHYLENAAYFTFDGNYRKHTEFINTYLAEKYDIEDITNVPLEERLRLTSMLIHALVDEAQEVLGELPWKPWKTNYADMTEVDIEAIRMEIVDVAHFVNNLIMVWFNDVQEFHAMFAAKLAENVDRQERGY
ncbi:MAG: dUTP diphosphatase [Phycisphaerales bacterium JB052]